MVICSSLKHFPPLVLSSCRSAGPARSPLLICIQAVWLVWLYSKCSHATVQLLVHKAFTPLVSGIVNALWLHKKKSDTTAGSRVLEVSITVDVKRQRFITEPLPGTCSH